MKHFMKKETAKKEKGLNIIWVILAIVSFMILISTVFGHVNEYSLKKWGFSIEADYIVDGDNVYAEYYDENGELHTFNLNGHSPVHNGDKIMLYHMGNIDDATPENTFSSMLIYYVIFGMIFALSMWMIKKAPDKR